MPKDGNSKTGKHSKLFDLLLLTTSQEPSVVERARRDLAQEDTNLLRSIQHLQHHHK